MTMLMERPVEEADVTIEGPVALAPAPAIERALPGADLFTDPPVHTEVTRKIRVRMRDIFFARRGEADSCAIARAIARDYGGDTVVGHHTIERNHGDVHESAVTPGWMRSFIADFDARKLVRPFTTEVTFKRYDK